MINFKQFYLINEISEEYLGRIVSDIPADQLYFNDIFEDEYRIIGGDEFQVVDPDLEEIIKQLKGEYDFDLGKGQVTRKGKSNPQKISKFIKALYDSKLKEKYKTPEALDETIGIIINKYIIGEIMIPSFMARLLWDEFKEPMLAYFTSSDFGSIDVAFFNSLDASLSYKEVNALSKTAGYIIILDNYIAHWLRSLNKHTDIKSEDVVERLLKYRGQLKYALSRRLLLTNYFGVEDGYYNLCRAINNLHNLIQNYRIVYTRHPIDILRMSDFKAIQSCHSPKGNYFDCAVQEANSGGIIAYLVSVKEIEKFQLKLQDKNFFYDSERNIDGAKPEQRLRLRTFELPEKNIVLAIPEYRTYGKFSNSDVDKEFRKEVLSWTRSVQDAPKVFKEILHDPEGKFFNRTLLNLERWNLRGGYYEDTSAFTLFNDFFRDELAKDTIGKFTGEARKENDEDEDVVNQFDVWQEEVEIFYDAFRRRVGRVIDAVPELEADFYQHGFEVSFPSGINYIFKHGIQLEFEVTTHNGRKKKINPKDNPTYSEIITLFFNFSFDALHGNFYPTDYYDLIDDLLFSGDRIHITLPEPINITNPDRLNDFYSLLYGELINHNYYDFMVHCFTEYINRFKARYAEIIAMEDSTEIQKQLNNFSTEAGEWVDDLNNTLVWQKWAMSRDA